MAAAAPPTPALFAEHHASASELPARLQSAFSRLRELDEQDAALAASVEASVARRLAAWAAAGGTGEDDEAAAAAAAAAADAQAAAAVEHAAEKVALAGACYAAVDALIVRLDRDLAAHDAETSLLAHAAAEAARAAAAAAAAAPVHGPRGGRKRDAERARRQAATAAAAAAAAAAALAGGGAGAGGIGGGGGVGGAMRVDAPVDPNEPVYCVCQRVSFGDMVACDAEGCAVEWYHLECVGLATGPTGDDKWYCPTCAKGGADAEEAGGEGAGAGGGWVVAQQAQQQAAATAGPFRLKVKLTDETREEGGGGGAAMQ